MAAIWFSDEVPPVASPRPNISKISGRIFSGRTSRIRRVANSCSSESKSAEIPARRRLKITASFSRSICGTREGMCMIMKAALCRMRLVSTYLMRPAISRNSDQLRRRRNSSSFFRVSPGGSPVLYPSNFTGSRGIILFGPFIFKSLGASHSRQVAPKSPNVSMGPAKYAKSSAVFNFLALSLIKASASSSVATFSLSSWTLNSLFSERINSSASDAFRP